MNKTEIIHLHQLFELVKNQLEQDNVISVNFDYRKLPPEAQEKIDQPYSTLGMKPTDIHKSKSEQKQALIELGNLLAEGIKHSDEITNREKQEIQRDIQKTRSMELDD